VSNVSAKHLLLLLVDDIIRSAAHRPHGLPFIVSQHNDFAQSFALSQPLIDDSVPRIDVIQPLRWQSSQAQADLA
jgi:hypothetical protein